MDDICYKMVQMVREHNIHRFANEPQRRDRSKHPPTPRPESKLTDD